MVKKGQIVINPKTSRPVKVGSRTWLQLVKEGIFEGTYEDPNSLYDYQSGEDDEMLNLKKSRLNKTLPNNKHVVKGRGKYKNKLVVRNKRIKPKEKSKDEYTLEDLSDNEINEKLKYLLNKVNKLEKADKKVEYDEYDSEDEGSENYDLDFEDW